MTRRQALKLGAATTLVATLGRTGTAAAAAPAPHLVRASYAGLTGQDFTVGGRRLRLASVTDVSAGWTEGWTAGDDDAFALRFEGPPGLPGETHEVHHPAFGRFQMFGGPIQEPVDGVQRYEAVIDRSVRVRGPRQAPPTTGPADHASAIPLAPPPELTLAQEHAAYAELAERVAAKHDHLDAADLTPTRDRVRALRRGRRRKPAPKRRRRTRKAGSARRKPGQRSARAKKQPR